MWLVCPRKPGLSKVEIIVSKEIRQTSLRKNIKKGGEISNLWGMSDLSGSKNGITVVIMTSTSSFYYVLCMQTILHLLQKKANFIEKSPHLLRDVKVVAWGANNKLQIKLLKINQNKLN